MTKNQGQNVQQNVLLSTNPVAKYPNGHFEPLHDIQETGGFGTPLPQQPPTTITTHTLA